MSGPKSAYFGISEKQYALLCCALKNEERFEVEKSHQVELKSRISKLNREVLSYDGRSISENGKIRLEKLKSRLASVKFSDVSGMSRFSPDAIVAERRLAEETISFCSAELEDLRAQSADSQADVSSSAANIQIQTGDDDGYKFRLAFELEELMGKIPCPNIRDEIQTAVECLKSISHGEFSRNYISITVLPLKRNCEIYLHLLSEYKAVFKLLEEDLPACEPCETLSELKKRLEGARAALTEKRRQEYISQSIDEAMTEMGYMLAGDRSAVKKSGRRFKSELFLSAEETAVNVTYSSDGQITMEIGGLDNEDRQPSNAEAKSLADEMRSFCGDYERILAALNERGVYVSKLISRLPADEAYAQIFNIGEYQCENLHNEVNYHNYTDSIIHESFGNE